MPKVELKDFLEGQTRIPEVLAQMGYTSLREGQETPINCIMAGRDTICMRNKDTCRISSMLYTTQG